MEAETMEEHLSSQTSFLCLFHIPPRPQCLGMVPPTVGKALSHEFAIKKMSHRHEQKPT